MKNEERNEKWKNKKLWLKNSLAKKESKSMNQKLT